MSSMDQHYTFEENCIIQIERKMFQSCEVLILEFCGILNLFIFHLFVSVVGLCIYCHVPLPYYENHSEDVYPYY